MTWAAAVGKIALAAALAYFAGPLVFWVIATGTWLLPLLVAALRPEWADRTATALTWLCRIGVFLFALYQWFKPPKQSFPPRRT